MVITIQGRSTKKNLMHAAIDIIKEEMKNQGISHSQLARDNGVGRPYLYRVLNGDSVPSMEWLEKVLEYLGVSVAVQFEKIRR